MITIMKASWIILVICSILIIIGGVIYFSSQSNNVPDNSDNITNDTNNMSEEELNLQNPSIIQLNKEECNPEEQCVPYHPNCRDWHATSYAPYKYCLLAIENITSMNNLSLCNEIKYDELKIYCISIITKDDSSRSICLDNAGEDRKLKAICHLTDFNQELQPFNGSTGKFYDSSTSPTYFVKGNCSMDTCNEIIWEEDF